MSIEYIDGLMDNLTTLSNKAIAASSGFRGIDDTELKEITALCAQIKLILARDVRYRYVAEQTGWVTKAAAEARRQNADHNVSFALSDAVSRLTGAWDRMKKQNGSFDDCRP